MNRFIDFLKEYKLILLMIIFIPIIVSQVIRIPLGHWTIGDEQSWIGFIGNYSGGVLGGIVAFLVARYQITKQGYQNQIHQLAVELPVLTKVEIECEKILKQLLSANKYYNDLLEEKETYQIEFDALIWKRWEDIHEINDPVLQEQLIKHHEALERNIDVFQIDVRKMINDLEDSKSRLRKISALDGRYIELDRKVLQATIYIEMIKQDKTNYLSEMKYCIEKTTKILDKISERKSKIYIILEVEGYYERDLLSNPDDFKVNR